MAAVSSTASSVVVVAGALTQSHWVPPAELRARLPLIAALADLRAPAIDLAWQDEALPRELAHDRWLRQHLAARSNALNDSDAPNASAAPNASDAPNASNAPNAPDAASAPDPLVAPGAMAAVRQLSSLPAIDLDLVHGWLLEPTHFHLAKDHLVLLAGAAQGLAEPQARSLAAAIEPLLAGDGMSLTLASPTHWLLRETQAPWRLDCAAADAAAGRNVDGYLPGGADARRYRWLLNEIQMTWHDHPANEQRAADGELPINSVWLSGPVEGAAIAAFRTEVAAGRLHVDGSLLEARLRDDRHAWLEALQALDARLHAWLTASPPPTILLCGDHEARSLQRGTAAGARHARGGLVEPIKRIGALLRRLRPAGNRPGRDGHSPAPRGGPPIADPLARLFIEELEANPA